MKPAQKVGFALTAVLVLVLSGSLVAGLRRSPASRAVDAGGEAREQRIRVEVLNAAGIPGLARRVTDQLRDQGFDVVYFGNGRAFHPDTSLVLDRVESEEMAGAVADAVEIDRIRSQPDSTLFVDVTVVVGRDWAGARVPQVTAPAADPE